MKESLPPEYQSLPDDVLFLTAGVDCQDDRLECVIMGHGRSDIFALDHRIFWGPIDGESVWHDLDSLLKATWQHPNGSVLCPPPSARHSDRFIGPR